MYNRGVITHFVIAWPGGSGKSTTLDFIHEEFPGLDLHNQINDTTRPPREESETAKSDYTHISDELYEQKKADGKYISIRKKETEEGNGNWEKYGLEAPVDNHTVFIVDAGGIKLVKEYCDKVGAELCVIFLDVDKETAYKRMKKLKDDGRAETRSAQYDEFMESKKLADYVIDSSRSQEEVRHQIYEVLQAEIMRTTPYTTLELP